jgi:hypothetical protein
MAFSCKRATERVSAAMDRRLSPGERFLLRVHLLICGMCRTYRRQLWLLRRLLRDQPDPSRDASETTLSARARERIRLAISNPP